MIKENCIMCQKPIGKEVNQWALQIRPSIWIHYHCLENLWSSFNATPFQKQLRAERDALRAENERLREALQKIKNWCCVDPDGGVETTISEMVEQALNEVTK